ncbi:MAG: arylsulfatase A-like enzyme [Planctomycetota bacterium]|jgi:arylsulfatase A-like enzyme
MRNTRREPERAANPACSPRSLLFALLIAGGLAAGCAPKQVKFTESVSLLSLIEEIPGEGSAALEYNGDHTDQLALMLFEDELVFADLEFPPGVAIDFKLRVISQKRATFDKLSITLNSIDRAGVVRSTTELYPLAGAPGEHWTSHIWRDETGTGLSAWSITLHKPKAFDRAATPGLSVGLLRPTASFEREIELSSTDTRPILLFTLDTLRADHLGCYGKAEQPSPRIDQLAAEASLFESCYSTTNVTNPSHASIFTSLQLRDHEVRNNFTKLSADIPNLVEGLAKTGYKTAAFVGSKNFEPGIAGFDTMFEEFHSIEELHQRRAEDVNALLLPWLVENRDNDFFTWVHYYDAHGPYDPPYPYNLKYPYRGKGSNPASSQKPLKRFELAHNRELSTAQYLGEIAYTDFHFGRVMDRLRLLGLYDDTTVILTSDHGESLGERGIRNLHDGIFENTTHVPLIIRIPNLNPGVVPGLVSTLDIYPTLYDFLGLPIAGKIRGASLREFMEQPSKSKRPRVFAESAHGLQVAVRTAEHRAILGLKDTAKSALPVQEGKLEMFDPHLSPTEQSDLAHQHPDFAETLRALLEEYLNTGMSLGSEQIEDEDFVESMGDLGYAK